MTVRNLEAQHFYEAEVLRGGWSIRQLNRQIDSQFYERTILSKNKAAMLRRGEAPVQGDALAPEEALKDPYLLEFLALKDEYSETDLEAALIAKMESSCLSWAATSLSSAASGGCAWGTCGTGSTCCSSIESSAA